MIYDKIENLSNYLTANSHFEAIIKFLNENNMMKDLECGSYDVGCGVKVSIAEYSPAQGGDFEAHRDYHDLQYAICGGETIEIIPTSCAVDSTGYEPDVEFFKGFTCPKTSVALFEGTFAYLTPDDAHKPCVKADCEVIKKAVFKIPVKD